MPSVTITFSLDEPDPGPVDIREGDDIRSIVHNAAPGTTLNVEDGAVFYGVSLDQIPDGLTLRCAGTF
ncbi:MAG: hypothetical protein R3330_16400, partial [Saprospiraceae bacterium]|nr:hypothetical protein [Saprospiraceae bacterium]